MFNAALNAPEKEIPALRRLLSEPSVFDEHSNGRGTFHF
jgi:hypothetical protein